MSPLRQYMLKSAGIQLFKYVIIFLMITSSLAVSDNSAAIFLMFALGSFGMEIWYRLRAHHEASRRNMRTSHPKNRPTNNDEPFERIVIDRTNEADHTPPPEEPSENGFETIWVVTPRK